MQIHQQIIYNICNPIFGHKLVDLFIQFVLARNNVTANTRKWYIRRLYINQSSNRQICTNYKFQNILSTSLSISLDEFITFI